MVPTQLSPDLMLSDDLDVAVPQYCLAISHILNGCWSGVDLLSTALGMLAPDIPYATCIIVDLHVEGREQRAATARFFLATHR